MRVISVKTNKTFEIKEIDNDYKELQKLVDGYIEPVHPISAYENNLLLPGTLFLVDEEGLLKDKEINVYGTLLYNGNSLSPYPIVGDLVILGETKDDFRGLTDDEVSKLTAKLRLYGVKEKTY